MKYQEQSENISIIRLDVGEPLVKTITEFASARKITAGEVRALGAVRDFELGYYLINEKEYVRKKFEVNAELIGLIGNLAIRDGKCFAHIHIAAGLSDFTVVGGHLFEAIVSATAEVTVHIWPVGMDRKFDGRTGLYLLDLSCAETS